MNPYRGEVALEIGGASRTLRYTWASVQELRREFGPDFDNRISESIVALDLDAIAKALVPGLRENWPDVTAEAVTALSPPIALTVNALQRALNYAFNGPAEAASPKEPANPPRAALSRLKEILSKARTWLPSLPASIQVTFGR